VHITLAYVEYLLIQYGLWRRSVVRTSVFGWWTLTNLSLVYG